MAGPSLTREGFRASRPRVEPHDHAVHVYDDLDDLLMPLEQFINDGSRIKDLNVFVHSFRDNDEARSFLARGVADLHQHEQDGCLSSAPYREALERGQRIDHDHVAGVVEMLRSSATSSGRRAPRIFVDASKNYFDEGRVDEWFEFERWLGPRLEADVGLVCAYRAKDLEDPRVLARVLETHQYRFDHGHAH